MRLNQLRSSKLCDALGLNFFLQERFVSQNAPLMDGDPLHRAARAVSYASLASQVWLRKSSRLIPIELAF